MASDWVIIAKMGLLGGTNAAFFFHKLKHHCLLHTIRQLVFTFYCSWAQRKHSEKLIWISTCEVYAHAWLSAVLSCFPPPEGVVGDGVCTLDCTGDGSDNPGVAVSLWPSLLESSVKFLRLCELVMCISASVGLTGADILQMFGSVLVACIMVVVSSNPQLFLILIIFLEELIELVPFSIILTPTSYHFSERLQRSSSITCHIYFSVHFGVALSIQRNFTNRYSSEF